MSLKKESLFKTSIAKEFDSLVKQLVDNVNQYASNELALQNEFFGDQQISAEKMHAITKRAIRASLPSLLNIDLFKKFLKKLNGSIPCNSLELNRRLANAALRSPEEDLVYLMLYGAKNGLKNRDFNAIPINAVGFNFNSDIALESVKLTGYNIIMPIDAQRTYFFRNGQAQLLGESHLKYVASAGETINQGASLAHEAIELLKELFACFKDLFKTIREALFGRKKEDIEEAIDDVKDAIEDLKDDVEDLDEDIEDLEEDIEGEDDDEDKGELEDERRQKRRERRIKKRGLEKLEEALENLEDAQRALRRSN